MKVAIISDIHENFHNLVKFFKEIENHDIKKIIVLGDLMNNGIAKMLMCLLLLYGEITMVIELL